MERIDRISSGRAISGLFRVQDLSEDATASFYTVESLCRSSSFYSAAFKPTGRFEGDLRVTNSCGIEMYIAEHLQMRPPEGSKASAP